MKPTKRVNPKIIAGVIISIIIAVVCYAVWVIWENQQPREPVEITILHTNDIHANVIDNEKSTIGFAKFAAYVKALREKNDNVLVVDAGDMFQGMPFANLEQGHSIVALANAAGYDAMTVGNHEFDFGADNLFDIARQLNFPIVAANIYKADGSRAFEPYIVKEIEGIKVGIFGMATPETAYKTHPDNVTGYTFTDMIDEAEQMVRALRNMENVDVVIMLSHLGLYEGDYTSDLVAEAVSGIDVIIDGHSHTELPEGLTVNNTLIASTGTAFNEVGEVNLTVKDGKVVDKTAILLPYSSFSKITPDPKVLRAISEITAKQNEMLSEVIGETAVTLEGTRELVRTSETNLGELIADSMLDLTGADAAIMNGGGIRASIEAGPVTMQEVITVLPFGNTIMVKQVKGSDLVKALEHSVGDYPNEKGAFLHVAGMTFSFDPAKAAGERVSEVVIDGNPIDLNKNYSVAMPDFIAAGGDGFKMFADYPVQAEYNTLMDTLADYIRQIKTVQGKFEARITVADSGQAEPAA